MRTIVYIDGFNLYYRALRNTPYRWLDLARLAGLLLPGKTILRLRYYTARISARPGDPDQPTRQQVYLRALATIPNLTVTFGQFLTHARTCPLASDPTKYVSVLRTDEKGSDVNLAAHLIYEGMRGDYDTAAIITNDSDLAEPVRIVTQEMRKRVIILCPSDNPSHQLRKYATFDKRIRKGVLGASQFPPTLTDARGTFYKPPSW